MVATQDLSLMTFLLTFALSVADIYQPTQTDRESQREKKPVEKGRRSLNAVTTKRSVPR